VPLDRHDAPKISQDQEVVVSFEDHVPTSKATSLQLDDEALMYFRGLEHGEAKKVIKIKVTRGDTEHFTLMNADTVPKLPKLHSRLFLTLQLLCSIKARAPSKNSPPFAYEGYGFFPAL